VTMFFSALTLEDETLESFMGLVEFHSLSHVKVM